ncbi:MAG: hypothetical protein Q4G40_12835, partial [Brachybacterium sp.]|nr:hypothetical protein [Brachybacterium sp.]
MSQLTASPASNHTPGSRIPPEPTEHTPLWVHLTKWGLIVASVLLLAYLAQLAIAAGSWLIVIVVSFIAMSILVVYSTRRMIPMKYLLPGLILLLLFQIWPIVYTAATAFTNYGDGHSLSKSEAVEAIQAQSVRQDPDSPRYALSVAVPDGDPIESGELSFLLSVPPAEDAGELEDGVEGEPADNLTPDGYQLFVGTEDGLEPLSAEGVQLRGTGAIQSAPGYRVLNLLETNQRSSEVQA